MAPYPKSSHLKDTEIRRMVGSAIFVELCLSKRNSWDGIKINDSNAINEQDIGDFSGQHRKMLHGVIPSECKCNNLRKRLDIRNPIYWRNHPYWKLLCNELSLKDIGVSLRSIQGRVQQLIDNKYPEANPEDWRIKALNDEYTLRKIAKYSNFKALTILTAMAQESKTLYTSSPLPLGAYYTRQIFAHAVCNTPQLFVRWPLLALRYKTSIWSFPENREGNLWFSLKWDSLLEEINGAEFIARKKGIQLPPKHLMRRINKTQLHTIYNQ